MRTLQLSRPLLYHPPSRAEFTPTNTSVTTNNFTREKIDSKHTAIAPT